MEASCKYYKSDTLLGVVDEGLNKLEATGINRDIRAYLDIDPETVEAARDCLAARPWLVRWCVAEETVHAPSKTCDLLV